MIEASLLYNPSAGRARVEGIDFERLMELLSAHGVHAERIIAEDAVDVSREISALPPESLLIIAGGDGTLYSAVQTRTCLDIRYALLPLGTANNVANSAGIPRDLDDAVETAIHGREIRMDLGLAGDRVFTQAAGAGFHAQAFHLYGNRKRKSLLHAIRAFLMTISTWQPLPMVVKIDEQIYTETIVQVTAANTPIYGRRVNIAPGAKIDDGLMDTILIEGCASGVELARCIRKVMQGTEEEMSNVTRVLARRVDISPLPGYDIPVHADAEPIGYAPVTIEVLPSCLRLMIPAL